MGFDDDRTEAGARVNGLKVALQIGKSDVYVAEGSDYHAVSLFRCCIFLGENEKGNVFAFERGEETFRGTENRL